MGKCAHPVVGIVDSQTVKAAETVAKSERGFDSGKKINGRKRHLVVDSRGLMIMVMVTPADEQDRSAARDLFARLILTNPQIVLLWGDSAYSGELVAWSRRFLHITLKVVARPPGQKASSSCPAGGWWNGASPG